MELVRYWPFARVESVHALPVSSLGSKSWRLQGSGFDILAREYSEQKTQLGIDRRREFRLLRALDGSNLAPRSRGITTRYLLVEWVPGTPMNDQGWQEALRTGTLSASLARLHQRECSGYPLNLQAHYARYWQISDPARRSPAWLRLHQQFLRLRSPTAMRQALLHMDLHQGNVLQQEDGSLRFIDWEYAGDGDVALELAGLFCGNALSAADRERVLVEYVRLMPGLAIERLRSQIEAWIPWSNYLILLWYESCWRQTGNRDFIALAAQKRRYFNLSY